MPFSTPNPDAKEIKATSSQKLVDRVPLHVESALTVYTVENLRSQLLEKLAQSDLLCLDLSQVDTCDCAGLQLLCSARKSAQAQDKGYNLVNCSQAVLDLAQAIGLSQKEFSEPLQTNHV